MKHLTDEQLESSADRARSRERLALHEMLVHLKEIDRRILYSKRGYPSIYEYAMERFKYSYDEIHRRYSAARLLKDMPEIESKIKDGSLMLTQLTDAQSFFKKVEHTREEKLGVLASLENKTKAETKKILYNEEVKARYSFEADKDFKGKVERLKGLHPHLSFDRLMEKICDFALEQLDPTIKAERIRAKELAKAQKVAAAQKVAGGSKLEPRAKMEESVIEGNEDSMREIGHAAHKNNRAGAKVPEERRQNINRAGAKVPGGREQNINRAGAKVASRYIAASVKREVWLRDQQKCRNCGSTFGLEFDHVVPFAMGGRNQASDLRLLCRNCNQRKAIEHFSISKIERFRTGGVGVGSLQN